jgi:hypothetical protein
METPPYAQKLTGTLGENTILICADKDFAGEQARIDNLPKTHQAGTLNEFPTNFDNGATSLQWNIPRGTLVVLFDDASGAGMQLALWGKGQIGDLDAIEFNDAASRWAWYDIGGAGEPRSAGGMHMPKGAQPLDTTLADNTIQLFDDQNFQGTEQKEHVLTKKAGDWNMMPDGKENGLSSLRWNLPEGVVLLLSAEDGGNNNIVIFGEGQCADLSKCNFDNRASRWSWAYIGAQGAGKAPGEGRPQQPQPRDPSRPQ